MTCKEQKHTFGALWTMGLIMVSMACRAPETIVSSKEIYLTPVTDPSVSKNTDLSKLIEPYRDSLDYIMKEVIGTAAITLDKGKPESLLGNFVSDLCFQSVNEIQNKSGLHRANLLVLNSGGLRTVISAGPITKGEIFELMPFENELVVVKMPYDSLISLFRYIGEKGGIPVSGLKLNLSDREMKNVTLNDGTEIKSGNDYWVATSDFLALGGDGMTMLKSPEGYIRTGIKVRDAIINFIQKQTTEGKKIESFTDGRIK